MWSNRLVIEKRNKLPTKIPRPTLIFRYTTLNELVHEMFPPLFETVKPTTLRSSEQWNNWNYWKPPLPNIEEDLKQQQAVVQSKEKK